MVAHRSQRQLCHLLVIGDVSRREFSVVRESLSDREGVHVAFFQGRSSAAEPLLVADKQPDVIVLLHARPAFQDDDLAAIRRCCPATPIVVVLGSWCEGETRTGRPMLGVSRVFWYEWRTFLERNLAAIRLGVCPEWGWPVTTSPDEAIDQRSADELPQGSGLVAVCCEELAVTEALAELLRRAGYATACYQSEGDTALGNVRAVVWDVQSVDEETVKQIFAAAELHPGAIHVLLAAFPRWQESVRLAKVPNLHELAKPFSIDDLLHVLHG